MSKKINLSGEVHISTGSVYTTVDSLDALKRIGLAYGLYDRAEEQRDCRVILETGNGTPSALVIQEDISHHGSPLWKTVETLTCDAERIKRYMAFRDVLKTIQRIESESREVG